MRASRTVAVRLSCGLLGLLMALTLLAQTAAAKIYLISHRGGRAGAPENTIPNFLLSLGWGIEISETDSWLSADGVPVLHHDPSMCRTTNIEDYGYDCVDPANNPLGRFPRIADFDLAFLKQLDVGSWWDPMYAGLQMPTLEEALLAIEDSGMPLLVEIKVNGQVPAIQAILANNNIDPSNLMVWLRHTTYAPSFRSGLPAVRRIVGIVDADQLTDALLDEYAAAGDFGVGVHSLSLTQAEVDRIHARGLFIYGTASASGSLNNYTQMEMGVDGIDVKDAYAWAQVADTLRCHDGLDNDGDGLVDYWGYDVDFDGVLDFQPDPECEGVLALSEQLACSDGFDNDGDGFVDYPSDVGCETADSPIEDPQCNDGIDNDLDSFIDTLDPDCTQPWGASEGVAPACSDGLDNDGDGLVDFGAGPGNDPGCQDAVQDFEDPQCDDGLDNDGDGFVDALDPSCTAAWIDDETSECNDGVDNDGDTYIDLLDPGCDGPWDLSESGEPDTDLDGVADALDNCTLVANPLQIDSDGDFCGNACDADYDNSGVVGLADFNVFRSGLGTMAGDAGYDPDLDHDGDDIIGLSDFNVLRTMFESPAGPSGTTPGTVACP